LKKLNVVICGGNEREAWLHWRAYRGLDAAGVHGVQSSAEGAAAARAALWGCRAYGDFDSVIADPAVHIIELLGRPAGRAGRVLRALEAGKNVLVGAPFAADAEDAGRIARAARNANVLLMSYENWIFYPPFAKLERIVAKRTVGRVSSVRMRTLAAGEGGWDPWLNPEFPAAEPAPAPDPAALLFREAFEKMSLAARLLGPIEEVYAVSPGDGTSAVVTWKHSALTRYGVLDVTQAPRMRIRSAYDPRDDAMEWTGSAGIIWLTRAASQLRNEPTLRMYRGENQFAYGHLDDDWQSGYTACVRHFAECVAHNKPPMLDPAAAAHAVACARAAIQSAETGERVCL
jgi:predicted dehydrogenase